MLLTSIARGGVVGDRHDGGSGGGQTGNARVAFCYRKVSSQRKKKNFSISILWCGANGQLSSKRGGALGNKSMQGVEEEEERGYDG